MKLKIGESDADGGEIVIAVAAYTPFTWLLSDDSKK